MVYQVKEKMKGLSVKQILTFSVIALSLILYGVLTAYWNQKAGELEDQQAATRWGAGEKYAQVSCFFYSGTQLDEFTIGNFEHKLEAKLRTLLSDDQETTQSERLFTSASSALGVVNIVSEKGNMQNVNAIGIQGDFFVFHPIKLLTGRYFSSEDTMDDYIILDKESAWQLFGSYNIEGQCVMINNIPHYVCGVYERPQERYEKKAGLDKPTVFLSAVSLEKNGKTEGISEYEIVSPNPVKNYLLTAVKEDFGFKEDQMLTIDNSIRFKEEALIGILSEWGLRSMQNSAIRYPYWENMARAYEDIGAVILLFRMIFLCIAIIMTILYLLYRWRNRKLHAADIKRLLEDKLEKIRLRSREEKNKWKHF